MTYKCETHQKHTQTSFACSTEIGGLETGHTIDHCAEVTLAGSSSLDSKKFDGSLAEDTMGDSKLARPSSKVFKIRPEVFHRGKVGGIPRPLCLWDEENVGVTEKVLDEVRLMRRRPILLKNEAFAGPNFSLMASSIGQELCVCLCVG